MSTLSELIKRLDTKKYGDYLIARQALRNYLDTLTPDRVLTELADVTAPKDINHLVGAGLTGWRWSMIMLELSRRATK